MLFQDSTVKGRERANGGGEIKKLRTNRSLRGVNVWKKSEQGLD